MDIDNAYSTDKFRDILYAIEEIEEEFELYKQCRQMEKLIDELARGRKMEKILRKEKK